MINSRAKLVPEILRDHITEEQWKGHTLNLERNQIGDEGAKALAIWPGTRINLTSNNIGLEGIKALAKWKGTYLDLSFVCPIGLEGIKALATWSGTRLGLRSSCMRDGAKVLAEKWKGTHLDLGGNYIDDENCKALATWRGTTLILDSCRGCIGSEGAKHLAEWKGHTLDLHDNRIGLEGVKALAKWRGTSLALSVNDLSDPQSLEGIKALVKWKGTTLNLEHIYNDGSFKLLAEWKGTTLNINSCHDNIVQQVLAPQWRGINLNNRHVSYRKWDWTRMTYFDLIDRKRTTNALSQKLKKRYDKIVILKLGIYFTRDIQLYVIGKFIT